MPRPCLCFITIFFFFGGLFSIVPAEHAGFPSKRISPDGLTLYLVFSGEDCFSVRKATVRVRRD